MNSIQPGRLDAAKPREDAALIVELSVARLHKSKLTRIAASHSLMRIYDERRVLQGSSTESLVKAYQWSCCKTLASCEPNPINVQLIQNTNSCRMHASGRP